MSKIRENFSHLFDENELPKAEAYINLEWTTPNKKLKTYDEWEAEILALIKRANPSCTAETLYKACKYMNEYALMNIITKDRVEHHLMSKQSTKDLITRGWAAVRSVHEVLDESFNIIERHGLMNQDLLTRGRYVMREMKEVFEECEMAQNNHRKMFVENGLVFFEENVEKKAPKEKKEMPLPNSFYDTKKPETLKYEFSDEECEAILDQAVKRVEKAHLYKSNPTPLTIWKYTFPLTPGEYSFEMPDDISIMDCQVQSTRMDDTIFRGNIASNTNINIDTNEGVAAIWALLNPLHPVRTVHFALIGTGDPLPANWKRADYIATIQSPPLVWHLFRIEKSPSTPENQVQD